MGPHEAYDDRKSSAHLDIFDAKVDDLHTPYVFPQECGRRADPRWITFRNKNTDGIFIAPFPSTNKPRDLEVKGWGWSASRYSLEKLESMTHNHELTCDKDGKIHVHIDSRSMGIGGYDSWSPNVDQEYLIQARCGPFTTSLLFIPITKDVS